MFDLVIAADILGIFAFALSGFLVGVRNNLDLLGLIIAASLTALGGGVVRDVILGRTPFAFNEYYPAITVIGTIVLALIFRLYRREQLERQWLFVISDTIGLVAFSITGALLALEAEFNFFGVMILSFLTAVGGGVLRDTMINQVPLRPHQRFLRLYRHHRLRFAFDLDLDRDAQLVGRCGGSGVCGRAAIARVHETMASADTHLRDYHG
jgi:uncharacterized membrane protein YeiH